MRMPRAMNTDQGEQIDLTTWARGLEEEHERVAEPMSSGRTSKVPRVRRRP
jgi:hypothetical protein